MHSPHHVSIRALIPAMVALVVAAVSAQRPVALPPGEATHFIQTPARWVHPKTGWGDPDLQGMWPISFVGSVPLERCAGGGGRGREGAPPCDPNKAFLTEEEYQARLKAAGLQVDRHAGDFLKANDAFELADPSR